MSKPPTPRGKEDRDGAEDTGREKSGRSALGRAITYAVVSEVARRVVREVWTILDPISWFTGSEGQGKEEEITFESEKTEPREEPREEP